MESHRVDDAAVIGEKPQPPRLLGSFPWC